MTKLLLLLVDPRDQRGLVQRENSWAISIAPQTRRKVHPRDLGLGRAGAPVVDAVPRIVVTAQTPCGSAHGLKAGPAETHLTGLSANL